MGVAVASTMISAAPLAASASCISTEAPTCTTSDCN